jgi:hypothetical protein
MIPMRSQVLSNQAFKSAFLLKRELKTSGQKKRERGPSFKLGGVSVNAKTLIAAEKEMEPLDEILPSDVHERIKWVLDARYLILTRTMVFL